MCGHCIYMFKDLLIKSIVYFCQQCYILLHALSRGCCKYMDLCIIHDCEMSGQLRASELFFSYFRVEIMGPIFLSFLKKKPDFSM